jgi:signal-transduction protein with cAMP-binding, CBS, and nucleotidyltransferase domain
MTVARILLEKAGGVQALTPEASVLEAIGRMATHHIGSVLVMREDQLLGILTERDYARKVILQGRSSAQTAVADIMSSPVITVTSSDSINHCMAVMTERRIRHLPVLEDGKVIGLVSIGDCVRAVIAEQAHEIDQLQRYIVG